MWQSWWEKPGAQDGFQFGNVYLSPDGCELNHKQVRRR